MITLDVRCSRRTSVHLCAFLLSNLAVTPEFYSSLSVPLERFANPVFDGVGLAGFNSRANAFLLVKLLYPYYSILLFLTFSSFCLYIIYRLVLWSWGLRTDGVHITLSALHCRHFLIIIIIGVDFQVQLLIKQ